MSSPLPPPVYAGAGGAAGATGGQCSRCSTSSCSMRADVAVAAAVAVVLFVVGMWHNDWRASTDRLVPSSGVAVADVAGDDPSMPVDDVVDAVAADNGAPGAEVVVVDSAGERHRSWHRLVSNKRSIRSWTLVVSSRRPQRPRQLPDDADVEHRRRLRPLQPWQPFVDAAVVAAADVAVCHCRCRR